MTRNVFKLRDLFHLQSIHDNAVVAGVGDPDDVFADFDAFGRREASGSLAAAAVAEHQKDAAVRGDDLDLMVVLVGGDYRSVIQECPDSARR